MKNIFDASVANEIINRINQLSIELQPRWGKMSVDQMLAHCNVTYEYVFEEGKYKKPSGFKRFLLKAFVKKIVVSEKPYKKNSPTAPDFKISNKKNFEVEKERLVGFINKCVEKGEKYFDGKESHSFGKLTLNEWNNMFYKHLDHHLSQFGV